MRISVVGTSFFHFIPAISPSFVHQPFDPLKLHIILNSLSIIITDPCQTRHSPVATLRARIDPQQPIRPTMFASLSFVNRQRAVHARARQVIDLMERHADLMIILLTLPFYASWFIQDQYIDEGFAVTRNADVTGAVWVVHREGGFGFGVAPGDP